MYCKFAPIRLAFDKLAKLRLAYCKFAPERFAPERLVSYSLMPCRFAPERFIPERSRSTRFMYRMSQFDQSLFGVGFPKHILVACVMPLILSDMEDIEVADTDEPDIDSNKIEIVPNNNMEFFLIISCVLIFISIGLKIRGTIAECTMFLYI